MPTLNIGGQKITVGDDFLRLSPEEQNSTVEEIAGSLGAKQQAQAPQQEASLFAPIDAVAELGARGINAAAQFLPESIRPAPRAPQPLQPFGVGSWQPSAAGMAKDLAGTVQSGVTLPGDVYAGRVDPLSEEGMRRAYDLASITPLSTLPTVGTRPTTAALSSTEIKGVAGASYDALRDQTRGVSLAMPGPPKKDAMAALTGASKETTSYPFSTATSEHMAATIASKDFIAPETNKIIERAAKAKNLGELVKLRKELGELVRGGGEEGAAATMARGALEDALGPQISGIARMADRDFAIASRSEKIENKIQNAKSRAGIPGRQGEGDAIRRAVEPLTLAEAKFVSPEVLAAAKNATHPGVGINALRALSVFDPMSKVGAALGSYRMLNPLTYVGWPARALYDSAMRRRGTAVSEALRAEAPATLAQPGYRPGGIISMPGAIGANTGILGPLVSEAPPLRLTVRPSDAL